MKLILNILGFIFLIVILAIIETYIGNGLFGIFAFGILAIIVKIFRGGR